MSELMSDPATIVALVGLVFGWIFTAGGLFWRMGSMTQRIESKLESISSRLDNQDKEIDIGRESRGKLHSRIDDVSTKVTVVETKLKMEAA